MRTRGKLCTICTDSEVRGIEAALIPYLCQAALSMTNVPHIYLCLITNCVEAVPGGAKTHSCA